MSTRIIDLTATLRDGIPVYPGDPPFRKSWHTIYEEAGVNVAKLEMSAHAGTHVDVPRHFLEQGADLLALPPHLFLGEAIAIDVPKRPGEEITPADFAHADIRASDIVLFRTGWEERSGTPRFFADDWPGFTPEAIDALISKGVKGIGGDLASVDSPAASQNGCPAHKKTLAAGLPIFEALTNLREVVGRRFFFVGLPLKIEGGEASPIRVVAILAEV